MRSVMSHSFSNVPTVQMQRSKFKRSHGYKTTFNAGYLIPVYVDEVYPGDTFNLNLNAFARLATPIAPIMDNIFLQSFFFFVPHRLVHTNFVKLMGEQDNPDDSTDYLVPMITSPVGGYANSSIYDYFGLPTGVGGFEHSAYPLRSYNLIWNTWFRDQNLQDSVLVPKDDASEASTTYSLLKRGKRKDYFTSCLPWAQKGPDVLIPLGDVAPVRGIGKVNTTWTSGSQNVYETGDVGVTNYTNSSAIENSNVNERWYISKNSDNNSPSIYADLSDATASTVNALRESFQLQKFFEKDARGGTRYIEMNLMHFGVRSDDARLQRPEYLGGGRSYVNIHPVAQNSETGITPQGNLAAFGTCSIGNHGFSKSFTEHGTIIGLVCAYADLTYQQGVDRMWSRETRLDFYFPSFAHLGEQAVLNKEIYTQGTPVDLEAFGFIPRFDELRTKQSKITGQFRSNFAQTLDIWHLSQEFETLPVLNDSFITENPPMDRVLAVENAPHFIYDSYINLICARVLPVNGIPGMIDHF